MDILLPVFIVKLPIWRPKIQFCKSSVSKLEPSYIFPINSEQLKLSDYWLYQDVANSPKEVAQLFIPYFQNPDSNTAAVAKALAGDRSQLPRLFEIFNNRIESEKHPLHLIRPENQQNKLETEPQYDPYIGDVVRAMIMLDANEAAGFLVDKIRTESIDIINLSNFSQYAYLMPKGQLDKVIEVYVDSLLSQRKNKQQRIDGGNSDLLAMAPTYVADKILKIIKDDFSERDFIFLCGLEPKLDTTAMPLLRQILVSENPQLRAWSLWQINRLDSAAELDFDKLTNDSEPAVRANAILFAKCPMPKQPDPICMLIRKLNAKE